MATDISPPRASRQPASERCPCKLRLHAGAVQKDTQSPQARRLVRASRDQRGGRLRRWLPTWTNRVLWRRAGRHSLSRRRNRLRRRVWPIGEWAEERIASDGKKGVALCYTAPTPVVALDYLLCLVSSFAHQDLVTVDVQETRAVRRHTTGLARPRIHAYQPVSVALLLFTICSVGDIYESPRLTAARSIL